MNQITDAEILRHVDHTLLKADCSWAQIQTLCEEVIAYKTASVCVPPAYVARIKETYGDRLPLCTVIGFPLGYTLPGVKALEAREAIQQGADEIDMVINLGDVKSGDFERVEAEISALREASEGRILKVIIETCYLTREEKILLCGCVTCAGADFIKTSTGFGTAGATLEDVFLMKQHIGPDVRIKAAGGIRTREDMVAYLEAGCDRLGTSSAVSILTKGEAGGY